MNILVPPEKPLAYKKDDFESGQEVRWCPGCGDYAILATTQRTLSKMNVPKENFVFISGRNNYSYQPSFHHSRFSFDCAFG